ncbi:MAG: helix-turn-helix transcriptional regulator [Chitinophagaceae bacterium]|nr:helix-turn-helix transcriptional regulator [Chitinophagaceae bacterium]
MVKKKKILKAESTPEFKITIDSMPEESKIFVDKSLEIAHYIFQLMEQKGLKQRDLAAKMGKTEAELSKILAGMHNLTLRSVAKLEAALGATIICTPKKINVAFPSDVKTQVLEGVKAKIEHATHSPLTYEAKVVRMFSKGKSPINSEAI